MKLNSLHILLTYQCNYECDHCFVWGSPQQSGIFTLNRLENVFQQALMVGSIDELYFEGGETFIYYPILVKAVRRANQLGFRTGIVSNGYWAVSVEDGRFWLEPLLRAGLDKLEISVDPLHGSTIVSDHPGLLAAKELGLAATALVTDHNEHQDDVMYRGRAAVKLTNGRPRKPWDSFTHCPYENLVEPDRIHLDPFGNLHLCQGIVIGNLWQRSLLDILTEFQPDIHPIAGPIITGGPSQLVKQYQLPHQAGYVDACHLCYTARTTLRKQFPAELAPDQMYGVLVK